MLESIMYIHVFFYLERIRCPLRAAVTASQIFSVFRMRIWKAFEYAFRDTFIVLCRIS